MRRGAAACRFLAVAGAVAGAWLAGGAVPLPPLKACTAPATPYEARVCADPQLGDLPLALERMTWLARQRVSAAGRALLARGEAEWTGFLPRICPVPADRLIDAADRTCVTRAYAYRIRTVIESGQSHGPYSMQRVEHLSTTPRPEVPAPAGLPYAMHQSAVPRIDRPDTAASRAWNARVDRPFPPGAGCDEAAVDTSLDYELGLVTRRIVGVSWNAWARCDRADVGTARRLSETWVLEAVPRLLVPGDLFRAGSPWLARLTDRAVGVVAAAAAARGFASFDVNRERVAAVAADPDRWVLQRDGIGLVFSELEIGVGDTFLPRAVVPWDRLRDVLRPGVP